MKAKQITIAVHKFIDNEVKAIQFLENYNFDPSGGYYQAVYRMMDKLFNISQLENEYSFIIILDDNSFYPVCILVSEPGEANTVSINLDDIMYYTEFVGAKPKKVIAVHNHPGEDSNPSLEDLEAFVALYHDLGDRLFDDIILSSDPTPSNPTNYYSFFEQGHIRCLNSKEINIYIHHLHKANVQLSRAVDELHSSYTKRFDALENRITALSQEVEKLKKL